MWSEEINKNIREAGDGDKFPFDEKSWEKMEVLLDKHLPQKKKRRGLFIVLLSISLLSIPAVMLLREKGIKKSDTISVGTTKQDLLSSNDKTANSNKPNVTVDNKIKNDKIALTETAKADFPVPNHNESYISIKAESADRNVATNDKSVTNQLPVDNIRPSISKKIEKGGKNPQTIFKNKNLSEENFPRSVKEISGTTDKQNISSSSLSGVAKPETSDRKALTTDSKVATTIATTTNIVAQAKTNDRKKTSSSAARRKFSINFSIGPDVSSVINNNTGRVETKYGLGLSYELSKKISVRTGFFVSRKVYSADSAAYHPDPAFWNYYPNLQKVDANCLVYEIPVSISYTFLTRKKNSGFVSTGLSSFLMKKETYDYSYKNAWGTPQEHTSVYNNENKHLFSALILSAGLRHQFNDRLSLIAEPYAQIPVKGVGAGKVKLNSSGILFTIDYKPFGKK